MSDFLSPRENGKALFPEKSHKHVDHFCTCFRMGEILCRQFLQQSGDSSIMSWA